MTADQYQIVHVDRAAGRHHEVVNIQTGQVVFEGSMADALALLAELDEGVLSPSTELVALKALTPLEIFAPGKVADILDKITAEVRAVATDISTPAGRSAVASLAYKVARSKTALDDMGKNLVADWKQQAAKVDAERRTLRERLDMLKDEVRRPLTDWKAADKLRIDRHEVALAAIQLLAVFTTAEPSLAIIDGRFAAFDDLPARDWQEFEKRAAEAKTLTRASLLETRRLAVTREAERAELERLRQERIAREQRERDERIALEAAERARKEAEERAAAEARDREAAVAREHQRLEDERHAAQLEAVRAENERREAQLRADAAEAARIKQAAQAEDDKRIAAAAAERARVEAEDKAKRDAAAAAERAEQEKQAALEAERKRVADAKAAEDAAAVEREADKKHRARTNNEALADLMKLGLSREQGALVVTAIAKKSVRHIGIAY